MSHRVLTLLLERGSQIALYLAENFRLRTVGTHGARIVLGKTLRYA